MSKYKSIATIAAGLGLPLITNAQTAEASASFYEQYQLEIVLGVAMLVCLVALMALFTALYAVRALLAAKNRTEVSVETAADQTGFWRKFWNRLNESVPVAEESTVMTSHSYDGIRELDNKLPSWWLYGFYATIVFGVVYLLNYHVFGTGDLQLTEYEKEMARAEAEVEAYLASQENLLDESSVTFSDDETDLAVGKEIYISQCAACHGQKGEGGVGPNLTDQYWIHGGDMSSIFKTIKYGVPSKGMISWQGQLSPKEMQQVSSFIYTMEGTNPPNAKEPQGERFEREEKSEETAEEGEVVEAGI